MSRRRWPVERVCLHREEVLVLRELFVLVLKGCFVLILRVCALAQHWQRMYSYGERVRCVGIERG